MRDSISADGSRLEDANDSIWAQYTRIEQSELFSHTDRFTRLLKYIVEQSLAGNENMLLGKNIAYEVMSVDGAANIGDHSSVRVEIGRLRRLLSQYYATEGATDPIRIEIPKGTYRADFLPNSSVSRVGGHRLFWILGSALLIAFALLAYMFLRPEWEIAVPDNIPTIAVLPFSTTDTDAANSDTLIHGLAEDIITDLSKIRELRVIAHTSTEKLRDVIDDISSLAPLVGATHALRGTIQKLDNNYRLNVNLTDVSSRQEIWSERYDFSLKDRARVQIEIAKEVSAALSVALQPKELQAIELAKWDDVEARTLFNQAMSIMNPPNDLARLEAAESLVSRIKEIEPNASQGYSSLALIKAFKASFVHAGPMETFEEVERLTSRALKINPNDAVAHVALGVALQAKGDIDTAVTHARTAVELQPSFSTAWAQLGLSLVFSGQAQEGAKALKMALRYDPNAPRQPYLNQLAVAQFHAGDYEAALASLDRNMERGGPYGPHMMAYRAATLAKLGRSDEEKTVLKEIVAHTKNGGVEWIREWLHRFTPHDEIIAPVLAELDKASSFYGSNDAASPEGPGSNPPLSPADSGQGAGRTN